MSVIDCSVILKLYRCFTTAETKFWRSLTNRISKSKQSWCKIRHISDCALLWRHASPLTSMAMTRAQLCQK